MDGGAWQAAVHRVTQSWTQLKQLSTHTAEIEVFLGCLQAGVPSRQPGPQENGVDMAVTNLESGPISVPLLPLKV